MITPFYVILLDITVLFNAGQEITSNDLLFVHYVDKKDRHLIKDPGFDGFGRSRKGRIATNLMNIAEIHTTTAHKAPSVHYAIQLTQEIGGEPVK